MVRAGSEVMVASVSSPSSPHPLPLSHRAAAPRARGDSTFAPKSQAKMPFLHVHAVGGLLDDDALRAVDHFVGHFLAAAGRQAVHENAPFGRAAISCGVDLITGKIAAAGLASASWPMLAQTSV